MSKFAPAGSYVAFAELSAGLNVIPFNGNAISTNVTCVLRVPGHATRPATST